MSECAFDTLLVALQDAVVNADGSIRRRREALMAERADASEHVLSVSMPQSPAEDAPCTPLTLPLRLFRDRRMPHIAMMSVEFDCTMHYSKLRGARHRELVLVLGRPRFAWFRRRAVHRVRISYLSTNAWHPQVEIDGRPLLPTSEPGVSRQP
jgi:hypothetical protein